MWSNVHATRARSRARASTVARPGLVGRLSRPLVAIAVAMTGAACGGSPTESGAENPAARTGAAANAVTGAPAAAQEGTGGGAVIASYAGKRFTEQDLREELGRLNKRSRKALTDPERRKQFVENFILSDLIFEEGRREGLDKDPDIRRQLHDLERRLVIQKVMQEHQSAPVTDDEVREYYESHADEFKSDRVKASHILVKEEALANDLLVQIQADPEKFSSLAEEHSIDKSNASRGGDLGYFGRGRMVKEFEEAAFALETDGQLAPIVKTRFGYHVIMRTEREDGTLKPFDDVKNQIRIRLINEKRRAKTQDFLEALKTSSNYQLDETVLVSIDLSDMDKGDDGDAEPTAGGAHGHEVGGH